MWNFIKDAAYLLGIGILMIAETGLTIFDAIYFERYKKEERQ